MKAGRAVAYGPRARGTARPIGSATALLLALVLPPGSARAATSLTLNHVVVAVRDLDAAARDFRALGFRLKPGRLHDNGIRNLHAKFPNGTEIELLTAPEARDALTARYREHLRAGDGPAFLALYAPAGAPAESLDDVFFGPLNHSPTDRPEHFAHENGARALVGVWLVGPEVDGVRRLIRRAGGQEKHVVREIPGPAEVDVVALAGGELVFCGARPDARPWRPVYGATVEVASREETYEFLQRLRIPGLQRGGRSVFVPPASAHGL